MKVKPRGRKYRNLIARGGVIQYRRLWKGRRLRVSTKTDDWDEAASFRDLWEQTKGIGSVSFLAALEVPTFAEFAKRYLREDVGHLAQTTGALRARELAPGSAGGLLEFFGRKRLDEITKRDLREWWNKYIDARGRKTKTGRNYLDALGRVLAYAHQLELIPDSHDPVRPFRDALRQKGRTKKGRAEARSGREVRPIESAVAIDALLASARDEGTQAAAFVLCMLDAGLRLGEVRALRWDRITWGDDGDAPRSLLIDLNIPTQGEEDAPKSGERNVALSRRLRSALFALYRARGGSPKAERVFPNLCSDPELNRWRRTEWRRIVARAGIGKVNPKDLRDTFASQLLTVGVQLGYVSKQLGHTTIAVTANHYAKWCGGDVYRAPLELRPGEIPADLLARLGHRVATGIAQLPENIGLEWLAD